MSDVLYRKQFGFQEKHSRYFIDLSKALNTVSHKITQLENYGVKRTNLQWFKSYLENCKQFTAYENFSTSYITISCGVPQGSILDLLLFLVYVNDPNKMF